MGGFYGSIHVRTDDRELVLLGANRVARSRDVAMLAGPAKNGWVGLYPENSGQDETVGAAVAREVDGDVLHLMVHDDDIFAYWLYRGRELIDSYHSSPGYFGPESLAEEEAMIGQPEVFRPILGDGVRELAPLLHRESAPLFAGEQLEKFAKLLKIRNALTSYEYLQQGESEGIIGWRQFVELPRVVAPDLKAEKSRLKADGVLLATQSYKREQLHSCRCGEGFLVASWTFERSGIRIALDHSLPPRFQTLPALFAAETPVVKLAADAAGRRIAIAFQDRIEIREAVSQEWPVVATISTQGGATGLAFSADGRLVAHSSGVGETISTIEGGGLMAVAPRQNDPMDHWRHQQMLASSSQRPALSFHDQQTLAFYPSGEWLAVAGATLGLIPLTGEPHRRILCPGGRYAYEQEIVSSMADADLEQWEKQNREQTAAQFEEVRPPGSSEVQIERLRKFGLPENDLQTVKSHMERVIQSAEAISKALFEGLRAMQDQAREGQLPGLPVLAKEPPEIVGFSRDGRWLWCGGRHGLHVYPWGQVATAAVNADQPVDTPPPRWSSPQPVAAVAEERSGSSILFGGSSLEVHRLDLETGEIREFFRLPGSGLLTGLSFSADGGTLATVTQPGRLKAGTRPASRLPNTLDVWDYARLCTASRG